MQTINNDIFQFVNLSPIPLCLIEYETGNIISDNEKLKKWIGKNDVELPNKNAEIFFENPSQKESFYSELNSIGKMNFLILQKTIYMLLVY